MVYTAAFATGAVTSTFLGQSTSKSTSLCSVTARPVASAPLMQFDFLKKLPNPFQKGDDAPAPPPKAAAPKAAAPKAAAPKAAPAKAESKAPPKAAPKKGASLPVVGGVSSPAATTGTDKEGAGLAAKDTGARGLGLLAEDFLKNLPEATGVGRQDVGMVMKPQYGEPGYKKQAFETVNVSELGISTFSDDKNYSGNVGGIDAIKQAAKEIKAGKKSGKQIKKELLKAKDTEALGKPAAAATPTASVTAAAPALKVETAKPAVETPAESTYALPDYLLPLPEDTPRKGFTWKNY